MVEYMEEDPYEHMSRENLISLIKAQTREIEFMRKVMTPGFATWKDIYDISKCELEKEQHEISKD